MESYEVLDILGEGTYGVVLKARSRATGRLVAIKRFKQTEQDEHVRKTSSREVRMLQLLRHPNVIRLEDVFRKEGKLYLVFEFIDHTILQLLESTTRGLSHRELRRYMYQLLRGIEFCHKNNVIHRDVKPENVLINESGMLKLCDFGFARQLSSRGKYTDYVATRWYRAPELLVGDVAYGKPVDVWALGCMFAELSDGQPLFPGESDLDQLCLILQTCGPVPPRMVFIFEHNPLYSGVRFPHTSVFYTLRERYHRESDDWLEFLNGCLQTDPAKRLTCSELMALPYFTRDGFRERYEAELRAVTGLPQLRSTPMLSAPSPTRRHMSDQAESIGGSLKKEATVSSEKQVLSDSLSPQFHGQLQPVSNEGSSDMHLLKAKLDTTGHDTNVLKTKTAGVPASVLTTPHVPASDCSVQLPMLNSCNSDRAIVAALTECLPRKSPPLNVAVSSFTSSKPAEVTADTTDATLLDSSNRAVFPLQASSVRLSPLSDPFTLRDAKVGQTSRAANSELRGYNSQLGSDAESAVLAQGSKDEEHKQGGAHLTTSISLPPSRGHEWASESQKGSVSSSLKFQQATDNPRQAAPAALESRKGVANMGALTHRVTKPGSPKKATTTTTSTVSSSSLGATYISSGVEDMQDLSKSSSHLQRHAEQDLTQRLRSTETSLSSSQARTRNPLIGHSLDHDVGGRRSNSDSFESSSTKAFHSPPDSSAFTVANESKKAKYTKHKKDGSRKSDLAVSTNSYNSSNSPAPEHPRDEGTRLTAVALVVNPLRAEAPPPHSHALKQPQPQYSTAQEQLKNQIATQQIRDAGSGPNLPDFTQFRSVDAQGPITRKERRSKPLAGSTTGPQGGDSRSRHQSQKRQDGILPPDGGSPQRSYHRATATLLALSALRNISVPPPTKSTGDTDKYGFSKHIVLGHSNSGGDTITSMQGGGGVGTKAVSTSRARRPLGMYTLCSDRRGSEGTEATRRARRKGFFATNSKSKNNLMGSITGLDKPTTLSSHSGTSSVRGAPYHSFKNSKMYNDMVKSQSRLSLRKPKKKMGDTRSSGLENTTISNNSTTSLTTGLPTQHHQQLVKEECGDGSGTARQFSAATAAAPVRRS